MVERLYIRSGFPHRHWEDYTENVQWQEVLRPFTSVKGLYISQEFALSIAPALQELVGASGTEVLPALQTLFFMESLPPGPVKEAIEQFAVARQLSGHPVAVSRWGSD